MPHREDFTCSSAAYGFLVPAMPEQTLTSTNAMPGPARVYLLSTAIPDLAKHVR